jgi:hypothetical protein
VDITAQVNRLRILNTDASPRNMVVSSSSGKVFQPYLVDFARVGFKSEYIDKCLFDTDDWGFPHYQCWSCRVRVQGSPVEIGAVMYNVVKEATVHCLEISYSEEYTHKK